MFNNIKSLPHTGDLQAKAFQGHYLKHKEIVEFRNISSIVTVHFVWYDYRDYMFNNIKSLPHTGELQTKAFQGHYLKHMEIVDLQNISSIDAVHLYEMTIGTTCSTISSHFLIPVTSKTMLIKVTTSNMRKL